MESPQAEEGNLQFQPEILEPRPEAQEERVEKEAEVRLAAGSKAQEAAWQQQNQQRKQAYLKAVQEQNA